MKLMRFLDLSLPSAEANLACDEALLDWCETTPGRELLRFWEPKNHFLVVGYSNRLATETFPDRCQADGLPILRRCSGGGTVLQGPGCLNYSLVLQVAMRPELQSITGANRFIMEHHRQALTQLLGQPVQIQGCTDLTLGNLKFSGNAQRRKRACLLFHGTFLLDVDLGLVARYLPMPTREPDYRRGRGHEAFLTCLRLPALRLKEALRACWNAWEPAATWPEEATCRLVAEKYRCAAWNWSR